jgi:hypothetical protein
MQIFRHFQSEFGRNAAGMDGEALDAVLVVIALDELAEAIDGVFRGLVVGCALHQQLCADRGEQDEMTAAQAFGGAFLRGFDEVGQGEADHVIGALHIHFEATPPAFGIGFADFHPRAEIAGIGVRHVDAAELRHAIRDGGLDLFRAGDVANRKGALRFRIGLPDQRPRLFESLFRPCRDIDRPGAGLGESNRRGLANPPRRAGDEDDLVRRAVLQRRAGVDRIISGMMSRKVEELGLNGRHRTLPVSGCACEDNR